MLHGNNPQSFPASKDEAVKAGLTYFLKEDRCPTCGQRFHWSHNGKCMGCNPQYAEAIR